MGTVAIGSEGVLLGAEDVNGGERWVFLAGGSAALRRGRAS
jgi:hypothetical protein